MTVLAAAQAAGLRLLGVKPISLFSAPDQVAQELADLAGDVAADIVGAHDWQALKELAELAGDGATIALDLPADFGRMVKDPKIHSKRYPLTDFCAAADEDDWLRLADLGFAATPGTWIMLGGKLNVYPAMPVGEAARFYYIRSRPVRSAAGERKASFTEDTDEFFLAQRLLELGLIWRWRAQKRMEYAEDLANYEKALESAVAADKGGKLLKPRRRARIGDASRPVYPGAIVR
uniref:Uncharacterized protein n=1 Tax=Rhodopseudomonas palustris (strain DX-1) TaxID=652103 RepID=E6VFM6_RHOPX